MKTSQNIILAPGSTLTVVTTASTKIDYTLPILKVMSVFVALLLLAFLYV